MLYCCKAKGKGALALGNHYGRFRAPEPAPTRSRGAQRDVRQGAVRLRQRGLHRRADFCRPWGGAHRIGAGVSGRARERVAGGGGEKRRGHALSHAGGGGAAVPSGGGADPPPCGELRCRAHRLRLGSGLADGRSGAEPADHRKALGAGCRRLKRSQRPRGAAAKARRPHDPDAP